MNEQIKEYLIKRINDISYVQFYHDFWTSTDRARVVDELHFILEFFYHEK